ncbi:hypothetical protein MtrunA17_Chr4g0054641 [Medicago truncatula]|uniref:Uncharacterized protein n=1 Tax=Medicago truncatula TaxID=3880 RepID=A0A396IE42_MEDTR|nr:hypothetical protein MtrunA17_Chr4g0054641 [Medicago truncatula]
MRTVHHHQHWHDLILVLQNRAGFGDGVVVEGRLWSEEKEKGVEEGEGDEEEWEREMRLKEETKDSKTSHLFGQPKVL